MIKPITFATIKPLDSRPQLYGWAPGGYVCHCRDCDCGFTGDKRARQCADCAYAVVPPVTERMACDGVVSQEQAQRLARADHATVFGLQMQPSPEGGLRQRCADVLSKIQRDAMMRQGSGVDTLEAFVLVERGRTASSDLDRSLPLVLYFADDADRDEFIAVFNAVKPSMVARKLP